MLEEHGILPDELFDRLTPHRFVALFFADGSTPARGGIDRVALMKGHNEDRAKKGLPPVIPAWMFPGVPHG